MPQASDELRARMQERFGDPISSDGPITFLVERGWEDREGFLVSPRLEPTDEEWECVQFLIDEWDFWYELPAS